MTNADAVDHWSGEVGEHWASEAGRYDRMNAATAERIIRAVAPQPGQRILDVGCGSGALALGIAPSVEPGGEVVGLDLSRQMLGVARARATERQLTNVTFHHGDAQTHDLGMRRFDSIVSRFGVMFFSDPAAAFANLAGALRPSGRLVFSCWQDLARNEWVTVPAAAALEHVPIPAGLTEVGAHGAFSLSDPQAITGLLDGAGFADVTVTGVHESMWFGSSVEDAVAFMRTTEFATTLFTGAERTAAEAGWHAIAEVLAEHRTAAGIELQGSIWLVTATGA